MIIAFKGTKMEKDFIDYKYYLEVIGVSKGDQKQKLLRIPESSLIPIVELTSNEEDKFKLLATVNVANNNERKVEYRSFDGKLYRNIMKDRNLLFPLATKDFSLLPTPTSLYSLREISNYRELKRISSYNDIRLKNDLTLWFSQKKIDENKYNEKYCLSKKEFEKQLFNRIGDQIISFNDNLFIETGAPCFKYCFSNNSVSFCVDSNKPTISVNSNNENVMDEVEINKEYNSINYIYIPLLEIEDYLKNINQTVAFQAKYNIIKNNNIINNESQFNLEEKYNIEWLNLSKVITNYFNNIINNLAFIITYSEDVANSTVDLLNYVKSNNINQNDEDFYYKLKINVSLVKDIFTHNKVNIQENPINSDQKIFSFANISSSEKDALLFKIKILLNRMEAFENKFNNYDSLNEYKF
jgi:hypothetical protein